MTTSVSAKFSYVTDTCLIDSTLRRRQLERVYKGDTPRFESSKGTASGRLTATLLESFD